MKNRPDEIVAAKAALLVRATAIAESFNVLIASIEADRDTAAHRDEELARIRRADRALADVEKYLRILTAAYEEGADDAETE